MYKLERCILFCLFSITSLNINAQEELKFERYTTDQGLVQNYVQCIFQDSYGFMWFGTRDGVSRFDGITFKNYSYNKSDSCSILQGWTQSIQTDGKDQLWIGNGGGLMSYNYKTDCFTNHKLHLSEDDKSQNKSFSTILYDSKGLIWTIFLGRPVIFNPDTKNTVLIPKNHEKMPEIFATFIYEDKNGLIWIGTDSDGLFQYNRFDSVYTSYKYEQGNPNAISSNFMRCIYEDSKGNIWIGTDKGGLNKYIPPDENNQLQKGHFEKFFHNPHNPNSLSHNTVYSICEDTENNLWIGTLNGLCLFDRNSRKFYTYYYDDRDLESLNDNIVRSLYCDKFGNLWVGTRLGIAKLKRNRFKTYNYSSYKNSLSHNKVDYLLVDAAQNILICTPVGIDYFNRKNNTFKIFKRVEKGGTCLSASPICMTSDPGKGYLIGAYDGGLHYYDIKTQNCTAYTHNSEDTSSLGHNSVFSICVDSKNTVWIGTLGDGVNVFNRETGEFNRIPQDFGDNSKAIRVIYEDKDKNIWAGTTSGLYLLDKKTREFKYYLFDKQQNNIGVDCLFQDKNRNLWIGTEYGLYRVNTRTRESTSYQLKDGLQSLKICSILEDEQGNIWISTKNGLARFLPNAEKQNQGKEISFFKTYGKEDGLQSDFLKRSSCKFNDGTIAFGGSEGLSIFHPDSINEDTIAPRIVLTDFKIFNKPIGIGEEVNGKIVLNRSLLTTDTVNVHYQNNNFTIEFTALHYRNSKLNQYAYKLKGYDNEWNYTPAQNRYATYTDLPYNTYTFLVKASNSDGVWSKETKELTIHVLPPWWFTLWFKILGVFAIISVIIFWFKLKTYKLRKQKKVLEEIVEHRTRQLKEANQILEERQEELQLQAEQLASFNKRLRETNANLEVKTIEVENMANIVHEADQSKLRFFANISHEFRTPLSLIIAPLEKLLKAEQAVSWNQMKTDYLQLMHRNAKRLLKLINEIIDFRKMDQGGKKLQISNNNIEEFIKEIVEIFLTQAGQKNISLNMVLENENQWSTADFWFDPDIMEKVLYNLISNAIKYTPEGGEVNVQLSVNNEQSTVISQQISDDEKLLTFHSSILIKISDTGIGIEKENLDKVFERFYRVETKGSFTEEGTGIGLAYTKELVLLHKGTISVESEPGKRTTFILQFPIGKEHFEKYIISDKSTDVKLDYIHSMIETETFEKTENFSDVVEIEEGIDEISGVGEKATILLVEDNNDLRTFIKEELKNKYKVLEAENGGEAWKIAFESDPNLIISDVMMPVMDGIALCKKIKTNENTSHIPVILLTAKTGDENTIEGLETGANDYITKPFDISILRIKINNILLLQKKLQEKFSKSIDIIPSEITHTLVDEEFIQKAIKVINENMQDYEFENDKFVELMDCSRSVVYRKIKNLTGQSVSEFIRSIRLKAAAQLFLKGNLSVTDVCYKIGFKHPNVLTNYFTKMFGKSPTVFIKENLKMNNSGSS